MSIISKNSHYGPRTITDGLVLCLDAANSKSYPGSGTTWTDLSGRGNNGTLVNGVGYNSGNLGSLSFDGVNDNALVTNPTTLKNQNFTISTWVNPGTQNTAIISIIDFEHAVGNGWVLQSEDATTNRYYYFSWYDGTQFQPVGGFGAGNGIQVTTSVWQNIVYSKNGTSLLGYINGNQVYTGTASNSNVNYLSNRNLQIGSGSGGGSRLLTGNISQVSIYNRALSAAEVLRNFLATRSRFLI